MADRSTADALDAELARCTEAEAKIAAALVELEQHPGHQLLTTFTATGETARHWALTAQAHDLLWQDFARYREVLARARTVRGDRARANQDVLRRLLRERSVELERTAVPLPDRLRIAGAEQVERISLGELAIRMDAAFHQVSDFVVQVDQRHASFVAEFAPVAAQLHAVRTQIEQLALTEDDPLVGEATMLRDWAARLERRATTDPLSPDNAATLAGVRDALAQLAGRLGTAVTIRDGWSDSLATVADELRAIEQQHSAAVDTHRTALELIADPGLPEVPDRLAELRAQLAALTHPASWADRAIELDRLRAALRQSGEALRSVEDQGAGLLERRTELRGRFQAYQAKAIRLGLAEQPDILRLDAQLRTLLWTRPCELAAATRALASYQRLISPPARSA